MWVTATKDELRDFMRDRLTPTFETCRPVKERMGEPTLTGFAFDGMPFYAGWSGSKARLQSKPIRWLFCDEVRNYPPGRLEMVLKRTRSFWNSRRFLISTPGTKGDAMDTAFSVELSGEDPVGETVAQRIQRRLKQSQQSLLAMTRGAFGSAGARRDFISTAVRAQSPAEFVAATALLPPDTSVLAHSGRRVERRLPCHPEPLGRLPPQSTTPDPRLLPGPPPCRRSPRLLVGACRVR
jgi:hypothetical protein